MFSRNIVSLKCRIVTKSSFTLQNITTQRSLHCCNIRTKLIRYNEVQAPIVKTNFIRHLSLSSFKFQDASKVTLQEDTVSKMTVDSVSSVTDQSSIDDLLSQIPEPPSPVIQEVIETIQTIGEPTFKEIGLTSWWPSGLIQQALEFLHIDFGMPWWACIVTTTLIIRTLMFPIFIKLQRYSARSNNVQPEMQLIQDQLTDARRMNDLMEVSRLTHELYQFMIDKNIDPKKNMWLPLVQAPIFISFFSALRGMVGVPVESMKDGGLWWFTDLTVPDPYCLLPLLTSTTVFITLELGTDTLKLGNMGTMKYICRAIPVIMFPFIIKFESAILCYWVTTNFYSLVLATIIKQQKVRKFFDIPELIKHDRKKLPVARKKFTEGFRDSWSNMKLARELGNRGVYDTRVFEKAGRGPIPKTYKFDPTKPHPSNSILAKKKD